MPYQPTFSACRHSRESGNLAKAAISGGKDFFPPLPRVKLDPRFRGDDEISLVLRRHAARH